MGPSAIDCKEEQASGESNQAGESNLHARPIPHHSPEFPSGESDLNEPAQTGESPSGSPPQSPEFPIGGDDLNERQHAAIELLVLGLATGVVAKRMEIDRKTLFNWRQNPAFQSELQRKRRELWTEVAHRIRGLAHPSLDELQRHLNDRYDRNRFRAALAILRLANVTKACEEYDDEEDLG